MHIVAVTREKNVKKLFTEKHDMTVKHENYLQEKRELEQKEFEYNRPYKIKIQIWKRTQLKVITISSFVPFLFFNLFVF